MQPILYAPRVRRKSLHMGTPKWHFFTELSGLLSHPPYAPPQLPAGPVKKVREALGRFPTHAKIALGNFSRSQ
jgi:hypothetical protein